MKVTDQFGRTIEVPDHPLRIVSLVPSQTEMLADFKLDDYVVGITRFCERPRDWFYKKARVGGTKDVDFGRIAALRPDLIIGNAEENTKEIVQHLEPLYPVWLSDVKTLRDSLEMMRDIGQLTHRTDTAEDWIHRIATEFECISFPPSKLKVLYLIWKSPWMAAGRNTFIHHMLETAGFENCIQDVDSRYPELTESDIVDLNPDLILLSSEPFPFVEKHVDEISRAWKTPAMCVDGSMFSWYGTRLIHAPQYFKELHTEIASL